MMRAAGVLAVMLLLAGCDTLGPGGAMRATVQPDGIELVNGTRRPVYYFVVNTELLAMINWTQCVDARCDSVPAGARRLVPLTAPLRDGGETGRVTVNWWYEVRGRDGAPAPGRLRWRTLSVD
jgi:hypothetical protein